MFCMLGLLVQRLLPNITLGPVSDKISSFFKICDSYSCFHFHKVVEYFSQIKRFLFQCTDNYCVWSLFFTQCIAIFKFLFRNQNFKVISSSFHLFHLYCLISRGNHWSTPEDIFSWQKTGNKFSFLLHMLFPWNTMWNPFRRFLSKSQDMNTFLAIFEENWHVAWDENSSCYGSHEDPFCFSSLKRSIHL